MNIGLENNIVQLKGATEQERKSVIAILMTNYMEFLASLVKADYFDYNGYWVDHIPISKPVISAKEFIDKNGK